ncbi:MAG: Hsp20/alpha crystallin family protein [Bacteroidia bacterium]|nr:Hsp20/alpha crystallin family protein [Bacteroidia bacterium]
MKTLVKSNHNGSLLPEFPTFIEDFLSGNLFDWPSGPVAGNATPPFVNISEDEKGFEVEVAAPGLEKNNFRIELENDLLMISAQRETKKEEKDTSGKYTLREFSYESFSRSFRLPEEMVEKDQIKATYKDGILHVSIPKSDEAKVKSSRIIEIS